MSLVAQLAELEDKKRQLLEGALAEIQALIGAVNEAGYGYTLVSSAPEGVATATARTGKQRKQRRVESGVMTPCPRTIVDAVTDAMNTDENALATVEQVDPANAPNGGMATLSDTDLWRALSYFYPRFHNLISCVAKATGMSIGHVQRVLDGERDSAELRAAIVREFRKRIQPTDGPGSHRHEAVHPEADQSAGQLPPAPIGNE
jgi:hypothetical protein